MVLSELEYYLEVGILFILYQLLLLLELKLVEEIVKVVVVKN
jgi:hypothetical protein